MSRFVAIDLAQLPAPDAVVLPDYEALVAARKAELVARVREFDADLADEVAAVLALESEPLVKDVEAGAYRELLVYQRINEAVRGVLLPTATGADLENIAARLGVERQVITPATIDVPAVIEPDEDLRERYQLALEAFSSAGPYGAYHFFARSAHPHVKHTGVYGPESELVDPGQVRIVVLSRIGDGTPTQGVIDAVEVALRRDQDRRPLTDDVSVVGATVTHYTVAYHLKIARGADPSLIVAQSRAALEAYTEGRRKVGAAIVLTALDGAAHGDRVNVERITRTAPIAEVDPGLEGATYCDGIIITYEIVAD